MPASHGRECFGTCSKCGKESTRLTIIDDIDHVCDECLDEYTQCSICGEYYIDIDFFETKEGELVCEYCYEDMDSE